MTHLGHLRIRSADQLEPKISDSRDRRLLVTQSGQEGGVTSFHSRKFAVSTSRSEWTSLGSFRRRVVLVLDVMEKTVAAFVKGFKTDDAGKIVRIDARVEAEMFRCVKIDLVASEQMKPLGRQGPLDH